jgi:hypothetical protein
MSHSLAVVSQLPDASIRPSGLKATAYTGPAFPASGAPSGPRWGTSQSTIVPSWWPEAKVLPSLGWKATLRTAPAC